MSFNFKYQIHNKKKIIIFAFFLSKPRYRHSLKNIKLKNHEKFNLGHLV